MTDDNRDYSNDYRQFTFEQIAATFEYDPETGKLWRKLPDGTLCQLRVARETHDKFQTTGIHFRGHHIQASHLMWMLTEHRWPKPNHVIDHRNGDVFDCRRRNLREANHSQSSANRESVGWGRYASDEDLERGVYHHRGQGRYHVLIRVNGEAIDFGY